jgi:hypothetical protein
MAQPDLHRPSTVDKSRAESEDRLIGTVVAVGAVVLLTVCLGSLGVLKLLPVAVTTVIDVALVCGILSFGLRGVRAKVVVIAMGVIALSGLVLAEREPTAIIGVGGLALTVVLLPVAIHLIRTRHGRPRPLRMLVGVLTGAAIAATALGVMAFGEYGSGAYALRYGTRVVVFLPDKCETDIMTDYQAGTATQSTSCSGAAWEANGVITTGDVSLDASELGPSTPGQPLSFSATKVVAYAIGKQAYTPKVVTTRDWFVPLGLLPAWLALVGPLYLIVFLIVRRIVRPRPSATAPGADAPAFPRPRQGREAGTDR